MRASRNEVTTDFSQVGELKLEAISLLEKEEVQAFIILWVNTDNNASIISGGNDEVITSLATAGISQIIEHMEGVK